MPILCAKRLNSRTNKISLNSKENWNSFGKQKEEKSKEKKNV